MTQENRAWLQAIHAADDARKAAFVARLQRPKPGSPADEIRDLKLRIMALESAMKGTATDDTTNTDS